MAPGLLVNHIDAMQWHTFQCFKVRPEEPVITNGPNMEVKIALFFTIDFFGAALVVHNIDNVMIKNVTVP